MWTSRQESEKDSKLGHKRFTKILFPHPVGLGLIDLQQSPRSRPPPLIMIISIVIVILLSIHIITRLSSYLLFHPSLLLPSLLFTYDTFYITFIVPSCILTSTFIIAVFWYYLWSRFLWNAVMKTHNDLPSSISRYGI